MDNRNQQRSRYVGGNQKQNFYKKTENSKGNYKPWGEKKDKNYNGNQIKTKKPFYKKEEEEVSNGFRSHKREPEKTIPKTDFTEADLYMFAKQDRRDRRQLNQQKDREKRKRRNQWK